MRAFLIADGLLRPTFELLAENSRKSPAESRKNSRFLETRLGECQEWQCIFGLRRSLYVDEKVRSRSAVSNLPGK